MIHSQLLLSSEMFYMLGPLSLSYISCQVPIGQLPRREPIAAAYLISNQILYIKKTSVYLLTFPCRQIIQLAYMTGFQNEFIYIHQMLRLCDAFFLAKSYVLLLPFLCGYFSTVKEICCASYLNSI